MNPVTMIIGMAMLALRVPFLVIPFQKGLGKNPATSIKKVDPNEQRRAALTALRDLDFDFQVGKVSEDDYTGLREKLVFEAARYMQDDKNDDVEALIQAR